MIKILFTSNLHLGIGEEIPVLGDTRIETFRKIIAIAHSYDLLLIGGDLFDKNPEKSLINLVKDEFHNLINAGVKIIYTPGETELTKNGKFYSRLSDIEVTHLFEEDNCSLPYIFEKNGQNVFIYGLPGTPGPLISNINKIDDEGFHIGLFHADFRTGAENKTYDVYSLSIEDINKLDFDFFALGHYKQFKIFKSSGKIIGAYPGSPEGFSYSEKGERYVLSLVLHNNEIDQIKRLTVNSSRLDESIIDCTTQGNQDAIIEELVKGSAPRAVFRLKLIGERDFPIDKELIRKYREKYLYLNIDDQSVQSLKSLALENYDELSLAGEFFRILRNRIDGLSSDIDESLLRELIIQITAEEKYTAEEFFCAYKNV